VKALFVLSRLRLCFVVSQSINPPKREPTGEQTDLLSPDMQWEYKPAIAGEDITIVKTGSNKIGVSFVDDCDIVCEHTSVR
jgi:hypothetical protein